METECEYTNTDPEHEQIVAEAVAHSVLRLAADYPGVMGRVRAARVVCGRAEIPAVSTDTGDRAQRYENDGAHDMAVASARFSVARSWSLKDTVALVDALIDGGLVTKCVGIRPTIVLTRSGFRALEALEIPVAG